MSCIVVLGNFKDYFIKNHSSTLRFSNIVPSVSSPLKQLDKKTSLNKVIAITCSETQLSQTMKSRWSDLPSATRISQEDEYWILKKTIYGLRRSPYHCYNMIKGIILKMGLNTLPHYPCLLSGVLNNPSSPDSILDLQPQLHVGLYVDDLVFYSSGTSQEALFTTLI